MDTEFVLKIKVSGKDPGVQREDKSVAEIAECIRRDIADRLSVAWWTEKVNVEIVGIGEEFLTVEFGEYQREKVDQTTKLLSFGSALKASVRDPVVATMADAAHAAFHYYPMADKAEVIADEEMFVVRLTRNGNPHQTINIGKQRISKE